jgi:hypothetical protein
MGAFDIQGKNCVFQLKIDDTYKTVVCAKSFTFNPITDMKETTTVGSGFWKEYRPRKLSYTITFNGMFQVESSGSQEKIKTMFDYQVGFLPVPYRLIYTDNSGNIMGVDGWVYVTSTLLDASPVNLVNGTVELQGNGPITVFDVMPDLVNINILSLGDSGIDGVFQFKLMNANGDIVFDSGQLPEASGGNLTHPFNVTGQVQKGTYSIFWQALSQSIGNAFELNAPPTKSAVFNDTLTNESTYGVQTYDFTANRTASFTLGVPSEPPTCVAPAFLTGLADPTATVGTPWHGTVTLSGSQPFNITNVTKPATMSYSISGNVVSFDWPAPEAGDNQPISFDVNNACGSATYNDDIDVSSNPDGISVNIVYTLTSGSLSNITVCNVYVNAALRFHAQGASESESIVVNPGDTIEVRLSGFGTVPKRIQVIDSVAGTIYDQTVALSTHSYVFVATLGHDYTVNAFASNP